MLTAIIVYLIIGGMIILRLHNDMSAIFGEESLGMQIIGYVVMVLIAPVCFVRGVAESVYQCCRRNKLES